MPASTMTFPEYIAANLARPFVWGEWDCCHFAAGWLKASSGFDFLADYPVWSSEREARRLLKSLGGLEAVLDRHLARINPNLATDGMVTVHNDSLHLFSASRIVGPGMHGLVFSNRMEAKCAWRI